MVWLYLDISNAGSGFQATPTVQNLSRKERTKFSRLKKPTKYNNCESLPVQELHNISCQTEHSMMAVGCLVSTLVRTDFLKSEAQITLRDLCCCLL